MEGLLSTGPTTSCSTQTGGKILATLWLLCDFTLLVFTKQPNNPVALHHQSFNVQPTHAWRRGLGGTSNRIDYVNGHQWTPMDTTVFAPAFALQVQGTEKI